MKLKALILFLAVLLFPQMLNHSAKSKFIVWNVGQGQWVTFSSSQTCLHIDMGGEFIDFQRVKKECDKKENQILFTHADQDHISFLPKVVRGLPKPCRASILPVKFKRSFYTKIYENLPTCAQIPNLKNYVTRAEDFYRRNKRKSKLGTNDLSYVWQKSQTLIPGDSTSRAEKLWAPKLRGEIDFLVLGHHGSKTSSSELLISRLNNLKMSFVSARRKVYGHPHPTVMARIKRARIPIIDTESWGNIRIDLE